MCIVVIEEPFFGVPIARFRDHECDLYQKTWTCSITPNPNFSNMPAATQVPARCPGPMIHHFEGIAAYITLKVIPTILGEICADYAAFMWFFGAKYTLFRYGGARNGFYFSKIRTKINEFLKYAIIASKWCIMGRGGRREACVAGEAARGCKMALLANTHTNPPKAYSLIKFHS